MYHRHQKEDYKQVHCRPKGAITKTAISLCIILTVLLITNYMIHVIDASYLPHDQYRCSHVPPPTEQVHHVWLNEGNFTDDITLHQESSIDYLENPRRSQAGNTFAIIEPKNSDDSRSSKSKRHIENLRSSKVSSSTPISIQDDSSGVHLRSSNEDDTSIPATLWNLLRKLERNPIMAPQNGLQKSSNDLVPMQIQVHYDSSVYLLDKTKLDLINETVIPSVVKFFSDVLSIKRKFTIDKFRIARRCPNNTIYYAKDGVGLSRPYCMDRCEDHAICGEIIVPSDHLSACSYCNRTSRRCTTNYATEGRGVTNTQLLLYVSAKQTIRCRRDQTIAYAAHCAQDTKTDRPVAGHANLCPNSISTDPKDLKALIATVKHELTHVLGFSVSLFAYYRDEQGRPFLERESTPGPLTVDPQTGYARWSDKVIKKVIRKNWLTGEGPIDKEVHLMVTPAVVREVRRHFNCSTLEGAELEDQGSDGTSMTHLEKRLFENEAMTGTHTQNSVYSRITLAVLQDTGWYVANFSKAERLEWGKDLGCDFAQKSCKSWIEQRRASRESIRPFCDRVKGDLLQIACTEDRNSKAVCNMRHYQEPLPAMYQNFDQLDGLERDDSKLAHYGGSVDLADYCPFIQEFSWQAQNVTTRGSRCDLGVNGAESEKNPALEHYGPESRCFEHGRRWEQRTCQFRRHWHHFGAGCYKFICTNDHLNVIVGNQSYPCYYPDQIVKIEQVVNQWLYNGTLICPSCEKLCPANKCFDYDKRIIDIILNRANNGDLITGTTPEDSLKTIFEEAYNMIDSNKGEAIIDFNTIPKYFPILNETRILVEHHKYLGDKQSLLERLRDGAPYIFNFPIPRPHPNAHERLHIMACSKGVNLHSEFHYLSNIIISISSVYLLLKLTQSNEPNK